MSDPAAIEYFTDVYLRGKPCPHCGHTRAPDTPGPRWHCPNCLNVYPEPVPAEPDAEAPLPDRSLWTLVAANALTVGAALWFKVPLGDLLLVYWWQSVMIGISFLIRMVSRIRAGWVDPFGMPWFQPAFFVMHYGFFHLVYVSFIPAPSTHGLFTPFGACLVIFALNHAYSLWYNIRRDRIANVNVATLFWLPYARIVPMHLTIILGPLLGIGLVLFLGLKTLADALMHIVEHYVLRPKKR
jgi:hypothetical protein